MGHKQGSSWPLLLAADLIVEADREQESAVEGAVQRLWKCFELLKCKIV